MCVYVYVCVYMCDFYKYHLTVFTYVVFHIMYSSFILLNFSFANFYKYYNTVFTYVVPQLMYSSFISLDLVLQTL